MKQKRLNIIFLLAFFSVTFFSFTNEKQEFTLKVKVKGLKNNIGQVQFALYNKNGTIPDEKYKNYHLLKTSSIEGNQSQIVFNNLPQGKYAVNILHDEDKDGEIDKDWLSSLIQSISDFFNSKS